MPPIGKNEKIRLNPVELPLTSPVLALETRTLSINYGKTRE
jgi:hypothetical protein